MVELTDKELKELRELYKARVSVVGLMPPHKVAEMRIFWIMGGTPLVTTGPCIPA